MPLKKSKAQPTFSFVRLEFDAEKQRPLTIHSNSARSHAAYWGGPAKYQRQQIGEFQGNDLPRASDVEQASGSEHGCKTKPRKLRSTKTRGGILPNKTKITSPRNVQLNFMEFLPSAPWSLTKTNPHFAAGLPTLEFYGDTFVKQFLMLDHEDYPIMISGCLLLSYAHSMAMSGCGTKEVVLDLKGQVIRNISARMKSSAGTLSPWCLAAIQALGAPIVCLVSQDLPNDLSMWEYINASQETDHLCCPSSADTAKTALEERDVHCRAMRNLYSKSDGTFRDDGSVALLQYLSNCMDLTMALKSGLRMNTPLDNVECLFPPISQCEDCSFPVDWTSPLTCKWLDKEPSSEVETEMLQLARLIHEWFATLLDKDSQVLVPTQQLLEQRSTLRQKLETFKPRKSTSSSETEAMYECCLWATSVLLKVEKLRIPIHIAAKHASIQPRLIRWLRKTDLSNLWGKHRGLLFWVAVICEFATAGQCFPLLCTTILARFSQEMAMLECCFEVAVKPLKRLKTFESLCCSGSEDNPSQYASSNLGI